VVVVAAAAAMMPCILALPSSLAFLFQMSNQFISFFKILHLLIYRTPRVIDKLRQQGRI
jgi:hypothetical protein